jgi:hypothetical protein
MIGNHPQHTMPLIASGSENSIYRL